LRQVGTFAGALLERLALEYVLVAGTAEVSEGQLLPVEANGIKLLLTKVDGAYYATQRRSPGLGFNLCRGKVKERALVSPIHRTRYDLATGKVLHVARLLFFGRKVTRALQTYPVQVNGYDVLVGV
jgi:nitrite reductase/ring-hydroxylating ferredoxin subunit